MSTAHGHQRRSLARSLRELVDRLTLIVAGTVVADVLDAAGQGVDQLLVEDADGLRRVVVSVDTDDAVVLALAVGEERLAVRRVVFLPPVSHTLIV